MNVMENIITIKGIGEKSARLFNKLGIFTISDLIRHYPRNYDVYEMPVAISEAVEGETITIEASICSGLSQMRVKSLKIMSCLVRDPSGIIRLTWYNQPYLINTLKPGMRLLFRGRCVRKNAELTIEQSAIYRRDEYRKLLSVMQPVYPLTEGLSNKTVIKAMKCVLEEMERDSNTGKGKEGICAVKREEKEISINSDYLPSSVRKHTGLISCSEAILQIHFPKNRESMTAARRRIVFDEFFFFMMSVRELKEQRELQHNNFTILKCRECEGLIESLPYKLTQSQQKVLDEVYADLQSNVSMARMIQGDVGSGKTIIAIAALLMVAKNGYQGCLMVPTDVLAKQHYATMTELLTAFCVRIEILTGSMTVAAKRAAYKRIENHEADIIVGTHALIQEKVIYDKLALVITDEQHRFGVKQREKLSRKGEEKPHMLVMSATPIPRSLAILLYGDLSLSIINELPAERLPIKNCIVDESYRERAFKFIHDRVREGRQVYIICAMVEESMNIEAENVIEYTEKVRAAINDDSINIEYLHGKMKPSEKDSIMSRFSGGEINILVSTTVVEVGVNVPNATVMMVENAERFGLAQLHQLRGRVGRGSLQSYCIFMKGRNTKEISERLDILVKSNDGFKIAEQDLKLRGPGDLFGVRQSGEMEFRLGDVYADSEILKLAGDIISNMSYEELEGIKNVRSGLFSTVNSVKDVVL